MRVKTHLQTEEPDLQGPDLLKGIKNVDLIGVTPNMVRALLLLFPRVGGSSDSTLRGEVAAMHEELLAALGVPRNDGLAWRHQQAKRYVNRDDMVEGYASFLKGGAHV